MTQKDLLLSTLKEHGQISGTDLLNIVSQQSGKKVDHVRRRLNELVGEGRVMKYNADGGITGYMLRPQRTVAQRVDLEQKNILLTEDLKVLKEKYTAALRYKHLDEALIDAYEKYGCRMDPVPIAGPVLQPDIVLEETSVSLLGDWHFWEVVDIDDTGGLAEYNMTIAAGYLQHLAETTIHIVHDIRSSTTYRRHYVLMLGDFISTNLHGILEHSPATAVDSLLHGQLLLAHYLLDLARYYDEVVVVGVVGNHGRLGEAKRYKKRYANWDYVLYQQLALMLVNQPNIQFHFPKSFFDIVEIASHNFLVLHGDDIKSWMQIPWYGINRAVNNLREILAAHNKHFDYIALGHFHNSGEIDMCRGEKFLNGAAIGTTDFSLGKMFTGGEPKQKIFSVHKDKGVTWRYPIVLEQPETSRYQIDDAMPLHEQWRAILSGETI